MDIRLKPELEKLMEEDVQRGPYQTADEFVERAVILGMNMKRGLPSMPRKSSRR